MSILQKRLTAIGLLLTLLSGTTGCIRTKLLGGIDEKGERIFLTPAEGIPDAIEHFSMSQDINSEDSKINYLLFRISKSNLTFVRNRVAYSSSDASDFLRWKLNRPRWRPLVKTAREFAVIITSGSVMSGQPYQIVFPGKKLRHELKPILINELDFLDEYQKLRAKEEAEKKSAAIQEAIDKAADVVTQTAERITEITAKKPSDETAAGEITEEPATPDSEQKPAS